MNFITTDWNIKISLGVLLRRRDNIQLKLAKIDHQEASRIDVGRVSNHYNDLHNNVINLLFTYVVQLSFMYTSVDVRFARRILPWGWISYSEQILLFTCVIRGSHSTEHIAIFRDVTWCMRVSDFRRNIHEVSPLLGSYAAYICIRLSKMWDSLSVFCADRPLKIGRLDSPETSVNNYFSWGTSRWVC